MTFWRFVLIWQMRRLLILKQNWRSQLFKILWVKGYKFHSNPKSIAIHQHLSWQLWGGKDHQIWTWTYLLKLRLFKNKVKSSVKKNWNPFKTEVLNQVVTIWLVILKTFFKSKIIQTSQIVTALCVVQRLIKQLCF